METEALNALQRARWLIAKDNNFDMEKTEQAYNFIVSGNRFSCGPDGVYFILSTSKAVHENSATEEDKQKSIAVGYKLGNRFANIALKDNARGGLVALFSKNECSPTPTSLCDTFEKSISDWGGLENTEEIKDFLNQKIQLGCEQYIPSVAQIHLLLMHTAEINKALKEAGGQPMANDWHWSSTYGGSTRWWCVKFNSGASLTCDKAGSCMVRHSVAYDPFE